MTSSENDSETLESTIKVIFLSFLYFLVHPLTLFVIAMGIVFFDFSNALIERYEFAGQGLKAIQYVSEYVEGNCDFLPQGPVLISDLPGPAKPPELTDDTDWGVLFRTISEGAGVEANLIHEDHYIGDPIVLACR